MSCVAILPCEISQLKIALLEDWTKQIAITQLLIIVAEKYLSGQDASIEFADKKTSSADMLKILWPSHGSCTHLVWPNVCNCHDKEKDVRAVNQRWIRDRRCQSVSYWVKLVYSILVLVNTKVKMTSFNISTTNNSFSATYRSSYQARSISCILGASASVLARSLCVTWASCLECWLLALGRIYRWAKKWDNFGSSYCCNRSR